MKTRIVRIGNSQGIRIPKPLLEASGLGDEVELEAGPDRIVIRSVSHPRDGWAAAFARMAEAEDDALLEEPSPTAWDSAEWEW
ncbi:MAG TPA: AbrB/MazE/SpoVT family DNA-binding domain-containing protein [Longimicrobiales bacterium]|nr:AbrB/MazE/SpoVT family DNA-binding domain-containing protein [Longimicrobiales bacterium]